MANQTPRNRGRKRDLYTSTANGRSHTPQRISAAVFQPSQLTSGPLSFASPLPSLDGDWLYVVGSQRRYEMVRLDPTSGQMTAFNSMPAQGRQLCASCSSCSNRREGGARLATGPAPSGPTTLTTARRRMRGHLWRHPAVYWWRFPPPLS
jgi:hypothetical protein